MNQDGSSEVKSKALKPRKSSNVPGQNLGFSLQTTRFLALLLNSGPGNKISLEVFEDVGMEDEKGNKTYVQGKSIGVRGNPIADRSVDLWKTFSNWVDVFKKEGTINNGDKFEIYVSSPREGMICESFSKAVTIDQAINAIEQAKLLLWGEKPEFNLKAKVSETIRLYMDNVFNCNITILATIIKNFSLEFGSGSPQSDLKFMMKKAFVPEMFLDKTLAFAEGWVKRETVLLLEQQKPAIITYDQFHTEITAFVAMLNNSKILVSSEEEINEHLIQEHIYGSAYIKQLEFIECDYEDKLMAVNDFLRATNDRTNWSSLGLIHRKSLDEFELSLKRTWKNLKGKIEIEKETLEEIKKGKLLFLHCSSHTQKLQGLDVPEHFTCGSFHALSDSKIIGWHPEYEKLF